MIKGTSTTKLYKKIQMSVAPKVLMLVSTTTRKFKALQDRSQQESKDAYMIVSATKLKAQKSPYTLMLETNQMPGQQKKPSQDSKKSVNSSKKSQRSKTSKKSDRKSVV